MLKLYRCCVAFLFYGALPLLLALVMLTGRHRRGLKERFAFYPRAQKMGAPGGRIWIHAASVGEVQAAERIIAEVKRQRPGSHITLTTMTLSGRRIARDRLTISAIFLAPLDVPWITERAIERIQPDMYICMETELWPVLLDSLKRDGARVCLANGRISSRAFSRYEKMAPLWKNVLAAFDRLTVISSLDRKRYVALGADKERIVVAGNVKYDLRLPGNADDISLRYRSMLAVDNEDVLVAGSTHPGEEALLLDLHRRLQAQSPLLSIIAPRHIERRGDVERTLRSAGLDYLLLSEIKQGRRRRGQRLVIVDTMGELALLYSLADYIFCGGSLVEKGGHNLMEAAIWGKAVFYGPHIGDFHDAADMLTEAGGGFIVRDMADLERQIRRFRLDPQAYLEACRRAGEAARRQQGSGRRQVTFILGEGNGRQFS